MEDIGTTESDRIEVQLLLQILQKIEKMENMIETEKEDTDIKQSPKGDRLLEQVTNFIHEVGVPAHVRGHSYIRDAVIMSVCDMGAVNSITKTIYPNIANKYNTTPTRVERSIRHAIEMAWNRGNMDTIDKLFGYTINTEKGKPTNSEFIAMIADKIRIDRRSSEK